MLSNSGRGCSIGRSEGSGGVGHHTPDKSPSPIVPDAICAEERRNARRVVSFIMVDLGYVYVYEADFKSF